jgi:hypothetical protein
MMFGQKMKLIIITACKPVPVIDFADETLVIVVKEFRLKMFGQHPGYFKAVFKNTALKYPGC